MNCGLVCWVDNEWPIQLKISLNKMWGMHQDSINAWIGERVQNASVLKELSDEKNKSVMKYKSLLADVESFIAQSVTTVQEATHQRIMSNTEEEDEATRKEINELKNEVIILKTEVSELKQTLRSQAEIMKSRQEQWEAEKKFLKGVKEELEKGFEVNRKKIKKIGAICAE